MHIHSCTLVAPVPHTSTDTGTGLVLPLKNFRVFHVVSFDRHLQFFFQFFLDENFFLEKRKKRIPKANVVRFCYLLFFPSK
jgi:hypothetical protein